MKIISGSYRIGCIRFVNAALCFSSSIISVTIFQVTTTKIFIVTITDVENVANFHICFINFMFVAPYKFTSN